MPDPALKEKAKEMFVINGFSMDTIVTMLDGEVSRKTLYNWRNQEDWDEQRRERVKRVVGRREQLEAAIDEAIVEYMASKDPKCLFAVGKATAALKMMSTFEFTEEKKEKETNKKQGFTEETLKEIESKLGLL